MYSPFKKYNMKPNFNNCSDIKSLRFFNKEICPYYCRFLHTHKDSGGARIYKIDSPEAIFVINIDEKFIFGLPFNGFNLFLSMWFVKKNLKGSSINYVVSVGREGGRGVKNCQFYSAKRQLRSKICRF